MKKAAQKKTNSKKPAKSLKKAPMTSVAHGFQNIWPAERDYMERPDRWKYVRKIAQPENCVFCDAHKSSEKKLSFDNLVLFKSKHSMVVVNKYPYNTGHLMVIPQQHCGDLVELSMAAHLDAQKLLKETIEILKSAYSCGGFNVGLNMGAVAGAGVPSHLHWHIIPRWFGDTNFFPLIAETKVVPETLKQTYTKLLPFFKDLK